MRPIRDPNYQCNGKISDLSDRFKEDCDRTIRNLEAAKRLADRDCPYDAESAVYAAQRTLRDAVETVVKCANNFEMTCDSRRCDAKPTDSAERGGVEFEYP